MNKKAELNPFVKLALDIGPLVLFFYANARPAFLPLIAPLFPAIAGDSERMGILVATAVFMVAVVVALAVSYALIRRFPAMTVVSAVIVVVFGGLTHRAARRDLHQDQADDHLCCCSPACCSAG